jgi:hypothetical protein
MTHYYLADTSVHYKKAHAFLRGRREDVDRLCFPTIIAERDEEVIGIISRRDEKFGIVAGPMVVAVDRPQFVLLKLADMFEKVLKTLGITTYMFAVDSLHEQWVDIINKTGMAELIDDKQDRYLWFKRTIA